MSGDIEDAFSGAQTQIKQLKKTPAAPELLDLYALFKQGTLGDATGKRPGLLDVRGRAKFDAWSKKKGMAAESAKKAYVQLVDHLEKKYGV